MLYIAADHGGFELKEHIKKFLARTGHPLTDVGAHSYVATDDYPDFSFALAEKVAKGKNAKGILLCRSGQGSCIAANKVPGIRAAQSWNAESARRSRTDDNSNILCLGGDFLSQKEVESIISTWLKTPFSKAARHTRRIKKITQYEKNSR
ncbi:MAG: RpiB/LacA/LacB family sugar-phosphate isomerase [Candidatus Uhrbacteria bacterium]|nr:RpiB/LacA/LacB family sugar-phosphate isomerase [Candidatus Uhrbacteria bacterium]